MLDTSRVSESDLRWVIERCNAFEKGLTDITYVLSEPETDAETLALTIANTMLKEGRDE